VKSVQCLCQIQHLAPEYYFKVFQPLPVQPVTCILLFGLKPCLTTCTLALHVQQQPPFCCSLVAYYFILFWAEYYFKVFQPLPVQPVTCILLFGLKPCLTTCTLALHVQQQPPFCCSLVAYYFILFWALVTLRGRSCREGGPGWLIEAPQGLQRALSSTMRLVCAAV